MSTIVEGQKKDVEVSDNDSLKNRSHKNSQKPHKTVGHERMKDMSEEEMSEIGRKKAEELTRTSKKKTDS